MGRSRLRGRPRFAWLGLLALFAVLLAACDASTIDASPPPLHLGGSVSIALASTPGVLLPGAASDAATAEVDAAIWAPLFSLDDHLVVQPELALNVPTLDNGGISPDGKSITLILRPGLRWSDGQLLTATDLAYAFDMLSNADYVPQSAFPVGEVISADIVNAYTVQLTLAHADASFIVRHLAGANAFAPLPKHAFGSATPADLATTPEGALPTVSSGPFTVNSRGADQIDLTKNPHYNRAPNPALEHVVFRSYTDSSAVLAALQSGAVDAASNLRGGDDGALSSLTGYISTFSSNATAFYALAFNLFSPIASDAPVREALAITLDAAPVRSALWQNHAQPTCDDAVGTFAHQPSLVSAGGYCAYGPDGSTYDAQGTSGNTLLDEDRWAPADDNAQDIRTKNGHKLTLRILTESGNGEENAIATSALSQWKVLGADGEVIAESAADLQNTLLHPVDSDGNSTYDIVVLRHALSADPDDSALFSSTATPQNGGDNVMSYANPQVDTWEQQQLTTLDQTARLKLLQSIHAQVLKDMPLIYLYSVPALSVAKTSIHNYAPSGVGPSETWNIADWWIDGANETPTAIPT